MEIKTALISVIVPVYNVEAYLERCICSIISQSYKMLEIILVDDGSTDNSGKICDAYKEKDERIKVIHKSNAGPSVARNYGLQIASGNYIGFIDSDDYIAADMYEELYKCMKPGIDIVCCGSLSVEKHKKRIAFKTKGVTVFNREEALFELLKGELISFSACDKLFRKELIKGTRFPKARLCEDLPFTYQMIKGSNKVVNIGAVKYFYCYRENSRSKAAFTIKRMDYINFTRDIYKDINRNFPQLSRIAEYRYFLNIIQIIFQIESLPNHDIYTAELLRMKKVLRHMIFRIIQNSFMDREQKIMCLKAIK